MLIFSERYSRRFSNSRTRFSVGRLNERPITEMAQEVAREMFRKPTLLEALARWWVKKYRLPSNHELFQNSTLFELLTDFWLDKFEQKPIEAHRNAKGEIQFRDTGDTLIDRWEAQIADGEIPDLMEAFDEESIRHIEKLKAAARAKDPYAGLSMKSTVDKISAQATREGITVSDRRKPTLPNLENLSNMPTFGFSENDDD